MHAIVMAAAVLLVALAADLPLHAIARGAFSQIQAPQQVAVRTQAEWEKLWASHAPGQKTPPVDLSTNVVVSVFLGSRPTAGFSVEIVRARLEKDVLVVEYVERTPPPGAITAQVLTSPFHIVALPRHDGAVRFTQTESRARQR